MRRLLLPLRFGLLLLLLPLASCASAQNSLQNLQQIKLPPGFQISLYADVPGARSMTLGPNGLVFVGTRGTGKVYALPPAPDGARARQVITLAGGLNMPNGVAYRDGALYVAEVSRILRYDDIANRLANPPDPVVVYDKLPTQRGHSWKFIAFGPDGKLYVPVGAPGNVVDKPAPYASILRLNADGIGLDVFARGIRNTVGFDWNPKTKVLWFTDNGRDGLGDNQPPDELNRASRAGLHFGYPYCHGKNLLDPQFGKGHKCSDYTPPARELGPHVAALGMRFYTGTVFPQQYRNNIFIAEHGSWDRSEPIGYRITWVKVGDDRALSYEVFAQGWLKKGVAWGRPVDVLVMPDGALLVSDDKAGAIYRITYQKPK